MLKDLSPQSFFMGCLTAFVGFASTFAVVLQGLKGVGASNLEAASGLMALCLGIGLSAIVLSIRTRMPISIAWSTPGAALLVTAGVPEGGFPYAVGAFIVCAVLVVMAGLFRPLGRSVAAIPAPLANAMLSGVILGLCFAPFKAIAFDIRLGLPIVVVWAVVAVVKRLYAVPAALLAFIVVMVLGVELPEGALSDWSASLAPPVEFVIPQFSLAAITSIALPLFIVTMASQNIPGIAVLKVNQYEPSPGPLFAATGFFSLVAAPFGGHAVNLAAITAAMCAGEDAHPDPKRRYWAVLVTGIAYVFLGLAAGAVTAFVSLAPPILIQAVAGLALIGAFAGSAVAAFKEPETREAAAVTFLITASGVSFAGISGAFWGLLAGGLMMGLQRVVARRG